MKNQLRFLTSVMMFLLVSSVTFGAHLDSFVIQPQYLSNGVVQVNASPQTILVDVGISRSLIPNTSTFEDVNWTVTVLLKDNVTDNQVVISTPLTIKSSDFNGTAFCNKTITAAVPANKYTSYSAQTFVYNSKIWIEYSTITPVSSGINTGSPAYSVNDYPVNLVKKNSQLITACCGISLTPASVWNGQLYNDLYDGYPVPIHNSQFLLTGEFAGQYGYLDWERLYTGHPFNNEAGTIINFNDSGPILTQGQTIYSPNNIYRLTLQTDGNLVVYSNSSTTGLWDSRTNNKPAQSFYFQSDLHLVLRNGLLISSPSVWATSFHTDNGPVTQYAIPGKVMAYPYLKLQDDGNLVLRWPNGVQLSGTGTATPVIIIMTATRQSNPGDMMNPLQYTNSPDGNMGWAYANYFEVTH